MILPISYNQYVLSNVQFYNDIGYNLLQEVPKFILFRNNDIDIKIVLMINKDIQYIIAKSVYCLSCIRRKV